MASRLWYVHLHDNNRGDDSHWPIGRGTIDFEPFFAAVMEQVPQITISLEVDDTMEYLINNSYDNLFISFYTFEILKNKQNIYVNFDKSMTIDTLKNTEPFKTLKPPKTKWVAKEDNQLRLLLGGSDFAKKKIHNVVLLFVRKGLFTCFYFFNLM